MDDSTTSRLQLACDAAREVGQLTLRYFRRNDLQIDLKRDATPVTVADREAEQLLRARISAAFPDDAILGEEFGERQGTSGYRWILDPIDGTKSFIHGVPLYSVLIGVERYSNSPATGEINSQELNVPGTQPSNANSAIGVIYVPVLDEMVYAATGQGAWHVLGNQPKKPARVSTAKKLSDGLLLTSGLAGFHRRDAWPAFEKLTKTAKLSRTWGDAYGYFLVATGQAEVMIDPEMNVWDAAAILPIMQEAGGTFTDWQGRPTIYSGEGIATNGFILPEVLGMLRK